MKNKKKEQAGKYPPFVDLTTYSRVINLNHPKKGLSKQYLSFNNAILQPSTKVKSRR
jgi:hypothetical protein